MAKILITGAAGFVGSHLIDYLLTDGVKYTDIRLVVAPWDDLGTIPSLPFEILVADIRNYHSLSQALVNVETVYHLASKTGHDGGSLEYYKDTIVEGTKNLINLSIKYKVKRFVFISSTAIYGLPATAGNMTNIDEDLNPKPTEGYGEAKLLAEHVVKNASSKGLEYIIIRPVTIFGPRDNGGVAQLIKAIRSGYFFYIGSGKNRVSYIYVKDLVKICRMLEKSKLKNIELIASPKYPMTTYEIVETISKICGVSKPRIHMPKVLVLYGSYIFKSICLVIRKQPLIFPNRVKVITSDFYFNVNKLNKFLPKFKFYKFLDAIKETIAGTS